MEIERNFRIVLVGDDGVGKSAIVKQLVHDIFEEKEYKPTLGASFATKYMFVDEIRFSLSLWDTSGQNKYRGITSMYLSDAYIVLIVYDISKRTSFENLPQWIAEVQDQEENMLILLIGNKLDKEDRQVKWEEGYNFSAKNGLCFMETSAKLNLNVHELFQYLYHLSMHFRHKRKQIIYYEERRTYWIIIFLPVGLLLFYIELFLIKIKYVQQQGGCVLIIGYLTLVGERHMYVFEGDDNYGHYAVYIIMKINWTAQNLSYNWISAAISLQLGMPGWLFFSFYAYGFRINKVIGVSEISLLLTIFARTAERHRR